MKILLVGGTGFIGSYIYNHLSVANHVDRTYSSSIVDGGVYYDIERHTITDVINDVYDLVIFNINPANISYQHMVKAMEDVILVCKARNMWLLHVSSIFADEQNRLNDSYSMKKHVLDDMILAEMKGFDFSIARFPQVFDYKGLAVKSQAGFYYLVQAVQKIEVISVFPNADDMIRNYIPIDLLIGSIQYIIDHKILGLHNVYIPSHTKALGHIIRTLSKFNSAYDRTMMSKIGEKGGSVYYLPPASEEFRGWFTTVKDFEYYLLKVYNEYQTGV